MFGYDKLFLLMFFLLAGMLFGNGYTYTLKKGETLYRISRKYNIPVNILQEINQIKDPSQIREGTRILIPSLYTIKKGDTLYSISRRYGILLEALLKTNKITDVTSLAIGEKLYIPFPESGGNHEQVVKTRPAGSSPGRERAALPAGEAFSGDEEGTGGDAAKAAPSGPVADTTELLWPHPGRQESLKGKISGIVIHGKAGDKIVSVSSGRVIWAGPYRGFGRVVFIESESKYIYVYAGNEKTLVDVGDSVVQGTEIGRLGRNAHEGVPQLIFLVYHRGKPIDPNLAPRS